ncbi:hypothetical protein SAMN05421813_11751 [Daejeonella rubra]|uniref:Uncharacterized protein n=1 Tax=Daejeonella rubra TaxID=990371 RepID=A0A1G9UQT4_9SPHI|nr:hypothetical protein [Daejeonella rubra]SDM62299.1 hypothetical protein SAMN05421813_11751 [Daejeonella rubra]
MEEGDLAMFDPNEMSSWLENAPKRESLEMSIKMIEKYDKGVARRLSSRKQGGSQRCIEGNHAVACSCGT